MYAVIRDQGHALGQLSLYRPRQSPAFSAEERAAIHIRRQQPMILKRAETMGKFDISPQQREVALLLTQGRSNQKIGTPLNVSGNTLNYHIEQLFMRLDAHDRADAVAKMLAGA